MIWQVFAGVLLGYGCGRALLRDSRMRARFARLFAAMGRIVPLALELARRRGLQTAP